MINNPLAVVQSSSLILYRKIGNGLKVLCISICETSDWDVLGLYILSPGENVLLFFQFIHLCCIFRASPALHNNTKYFLVGVT